MGLSKKEIKKRIREYKNIKKPKMPHKFSKEEYDAKKKELLEELDDVTSTIEANMGSVRSRVFDMALENIQKTIEYYFDPFTYRRNTRRDRLFLKSVKEIAKLLKYHAKLEKEPYRECLQKLKDLKDAFEEQRTYIGEIEAKYYDKKKKS